MNKAQSMEAITRFAPSPTGPLHLGHGLAAIVAFDLARANEPHGKFLLRIEDIDTTRVRAEYEQAIYADLKWLGLKWEPDIRRQSEHMVDYKKALDELDDMGLLYPCFCTRKEIQQEISAAITAPHLINTSKGPDGPIYPGTCRGLGPEQTQENISAGKPHVLRLNMERALEVVKKMGSPLEWHDETKGKITARPEIFGDVVLARKDITTSYHLAVTIDDHIQGISMVTRGEDLFPVTHIHRLLQALLSLNVPNYFHHRLIMGNDGTRMATRDKSITLKSLRDLGHDEMSIRKMLEL